MSRIIDLTRQSMGWNNPPTTRTTNQIRRLAVHHSATNVGNQAIFQNHWRNQGWRVGGYHEIILRNGDVEICYVPTTVVNGVRSHNLDTYHMCTVGNSNFTPEQERSLIERIRFNMNRFQIPIERVLGHNEFSGAATNCPGRNMNALRNNLRLPTVTTPPVNNTTPNTHTVRSGDTLSAIARNHGTTVAELQRLNNIANANLIRIGQVLRLPTTNTAPSTPPQPTIRVGSRVRVNDNVQRWATGQNIPSWVLGRTYTVQQMRNSNNELLLTDVVSWIRRSDVTLV